MKKLFSTLLLFGIIFLGANPSYSTTNAYDMYGRKTGSYKQTSNGYNSYNQYGQKTGSYRETSSVRRTDTGGRCRKIK